MPSLRNWRKKRVTESNDKKVPALRFKGFTDDWEQRKLGDMANILRGASPRPIKDKKWFDTNSRIGWIRISDVTSQNGRVYTLGQHLSKKGQEKTRVVSSQTLLLSIAASVGYPVITYVETGVHDGFVIFDKPKFNLDFMFFKLQSIQNIWNKYGQAGSQVNINSSIVANTSISIPNIEEQKRISILLKKIEENIYLQQRKLEQIKLLKKAMLQKILAETDNPYPKLRFFGFSNTWKKYTVNSLFKISRGYVLSTTLTEANKSAHNPYPVYSSQTKNNGLMGYYNKYLYENAITWTTDGANAGTVNYRSGKFYCTNVCGVILSDKVDANQLIAEELNTVSKRYVSYVGNPKLMNNVMANIKIIIPDQYKERQQISQLFSRQDIFKDVYQRKQNVLKILKQFLLQNMFI